MSEDINNNQNGVRLKVMEATQEDIDKGLVRIDSYAMKELGIRPGDIVMLEGNDQTVAIATRAYPADVGLNIIRMDGLTRRNAGTSLGEYIKVFPVQAKPAKRVTIAPVQKGVSIQIMGQPTAIKRALIGRPVVKGDIITLGGTSARKKTFSGSAFEDIFRMFEDDFSNLSGTPFGMSGIKFAVVSTNPKDVVLITDVTELVLKPEAVEIKEEMVPDITYEDIGGLAEEITKIREMVELPLKRPELFQKLGIEAPKGVLLYGPPGTGKTLLAKAVANESNAHFISINGPEVMCVSGKTPILLNPKGYESAEDLFNQAKTLGVEVLESPLTFDVTGKGFKTYAVNEQGEIVPADITHVTTLEAEAHEFKLSDGQSVTVSSNQPFLTVDEGGNIIWKKSSELHENDFVAVASKINGDFDSYDLPSIKSRSVKTLIFPKRTSPELMELIGMILSDGHLSKRGDAVEFANINPELRTRFIDLVSFLFGIDRGRFNTNNKEKVSINSVDLVEFLNKSCLIPRGKKIDYGIPDYLFKLLDDEVAAFVRGYFEGDGTISKGTKGYPTIRIYSSSEKLVKDLQALLSLRLGIHSKTGLWSNKLSKVYTLVVKGYDGRVEFAKTVGTISSAKGRLLEPLLATKLRRSSEFLPEIKTFLRRVKDELGIKYDKIRSYQGYFYGGKRLTKNVLEKLYQIFGQCSEGFKSDVIEKLLSPNISWVKINAINNVGKITLYDLSVEKYDNFIGGTLLLHNSKWVGEAEKKLRKVFEDASENAPSIIFIDEIDSIAPKREEVTGEVERRVVAQLLASMDGLSSRGKVIVIAATNRQNAIDPALRRPGRFDREIEIGVPDIKGREIIFKIHTRNMPLLEDVDIKQLSKRSHGFVGADVEAVCKEAAMLTLRRVLPQLKESESDDEIPPEILEKLQVNMEDFNGAMRLVQPSAMREVLVEIPNVKWEDIGGLEKAKEELKESVEWPLKYPNSFRDLGVMPPKGILLYGPPGTGKTLLAKAVANESEANFISIKGPELLSKWVGESEKALREIFRKARQVAPAIIFFDEIDSVAGRRGLEIGTKVKESMVNQLLTEMDGLEQLHDIVIIAATNRPDMIDPGLLRPGRFDKMIYTGVPDEKSRLKIIETQVKKVPLSEDVNIKELAKKSEGFSGADLNGLVREAAMIALRKNKKAKTVTKENFDEALKEVSPSITNEIKEFYEEFLKRLKSIRTKETIESTTYFG